MLSELEESSLSRLVSIMTRNLSIIPQYHSRHNLGNTCEVMEVVALGDCSSWRPRAQRGCSHRPLGLSHARDEYNGDIQRDREDGVN